jgi:predicted DNA-binding transcriptional regulator AlpA
MRQDALHMAPVPTLSDLISHPEQARNLPPQVAADLLAQVASLQPLLLARLFVGFGQDRREDDSGGDRLLMVGEAAAMLGMTRDYLYRHADQLPFTIRPSAKQLRFSKAGIQRYIRQRQGR